MSEQLRRTNRDGIRNLTGVDPSINNGILLNEFIETMYKISLNKTPRRDNITIEIIIYNGLHLWKLLTCFFNECLSNGYPNCFKIVYIVLLYKKRDTKKCNNYRPIKLIIVVGKIFESIIANRIHFTLYAKIHDSQYGFHVGRDDIE